MNEQHQLIVGIDNIMKIVYCAHTNKKVRSERKKKEEQKQVS